MLPEKQIHPGGGAATMISLFSALGGRAAFQGIYGKDSLGEMFVNSLQCLGVDVNAMKRHRSKNNAVVLSLITPDKDRSFAC